jgi:hypothetical protein
MMSNWNGTIIGPGHVRPPLLLNFQPILNVRLIISILITPRPYMRIGSTASRSLAARHTLTFPLKYASTRASTFPLSTRQTEKLILPSYRSWHLGLGISASKVCWSRLESACPFHGFHLSTGVNAGCIGRWLHSTIENYLNPRKARTSETTADSNRRALHGVPLVVHRSCDVYDPPTTSLFLLNICITL